MDAKVQERQVPKCLLFLAISALLSHVILLAGNLHFAEGILNLGHSSTGWANVGIGLSDAFNGELTEVMVTMNDKITTMVGNITEVQDIMDLAMSTVGNATDNSEIAQLTEPEIRRMLALLKEKLRQFLATAKPILIQVGGMQQSWNDKISSGLETFSTTIDRSQKVFDGVMAQINGCCENEDYMLQNTFSLFDVSNSGGITVADLEDTADLYSISALKGSVSQKLHARYDANGDGKLDTQEYAALVHAKELPFVMSTVLRSYAKSLAEVAGEIRHARMRSEVAAATANYLTLVVAKNATKVGWISAALVDGSLPLEFTSTVLVQLAINSDDPETLTSADVGAVIARKMASLDSHVLLNSLQQIMDPKFWEEEGLQTDLQPDVVGKITNWTDRAGVKKSLLLTSIGAATHAHTAESMSLVAAARDGAALRLQDYHANRRAEKAALFHRNYFSEASKHLLTELFGGSSPSASRSPDAGAAVNSGKPAAPETILWAQQLAWNASGVAHVFHSQCFHYSGTSSGVMDSFATEIQGMLKKVQSFLTTMEQWSSPRGVQRLETMILEFLDHAESEILQKLKGLFPPAAKAGETIVIEDSLTDTWSQVNTFLQQILAILPAAQKNMIFARQKVSQISSQLETVFANVKQTAPDIFVDVSARYKKMWVLHFCFFAPCTMLALLYGFWANGYWGGPKVSDGGRGAEDAAPKTFCEKMATYFSACRGCNDNLLCFWSCLIICQMVVLCMFVSEIFLVILAGIQAFMAAGCSEVYILGDYTICTHAIDVLHKFLSSFKVGSTFREDVCTSSELLLCRQIGQTMAKATLMMVIGGLAAAILSFQMLIESAVLHERSRCRRIVEAQFGKST